MAIKQFRCSGCQQLHRERVAEQKYCGAPACQRMRRNAWRREHYATDTIYRLTARDSTRAWLAAQGGAKSYYRTYRLRQKQRLQRDAGKRRARLRTPDRDGQELLRETSRSNANSDAKSAQPAVTTGQYLLSLAGGQGGANSDAIIVELTVINGQSPGLQRTTDCFCEESSARVGG